MRYFLFLCVICTTLACQPHTYPAVNHTAPVRDEPIYVPGKRYEFHYYILKTDGNYAEVEADGSWAAESSGGHIHRSILLHLPDLPPNKTTNSKQRELVYIHKDFKIVEQTGLIENSVNTWLHPPRLGGLKALAMCPYMYLRHDLPEGTFWADSVIIGDQWADPRWAQWKGRLHISFQYQNIGKVDLLTPFGPLECIQINGTGQSRAGNMRMEALYHPKYGFISGLFIPPSGIVIIMQLFSMREVPVYKSISELIEAEQMQP